MKNLTGFGITGLILIIAVASVSGLVYAIQTRANELLYYKELSKQRTVYEDMVTVCGGPSGLMCADGYTCKLNEESARGIGKCVPSGGN